ncbi:MAG: hypothetical protein ABSH56_25340 [Bryobacteraceae bacterium]
MDSRERVVTGDAFTCETKSGVPAMPLGADRIRTAALADTVLIQQTNPPGGQPPDLSFSVFNPSAFGTLSRWALDLRIEEVEISPDGKDVVARQGGRLLRIPITEEGEIEVAQRGITREFIKGECEQFFPGVPCPKVMPAVRQR